ncbi:hypothetical protein ABKV19_026976 [Rosa sericea]
MAADPDFKKHFTLSLQQPHCSKILITCSQTDDAAHEICDEDDTTTPSLYTLEDSPGARQIYFKQCVPLYNAALIGDWKTAKRIIEKDKSILGASITKGWQTVLHVAAGARHVCFVKKLLKLLKEEDLVLQDQNGNTPFCFAVAAGAVRVAKIMIQKNPRLPEIRGGQGMTPLYFAALFGHGHMASYLYPQLIQLVDEGERAGIFFTCINNSLYGLALKMLHDYPELAVARNKNNETALHLLAQKPSAFSRKSSGIWKSFVHYCTNKGKLKNTQGLQLLKRLWEEVLCKNEGIVTDVIRRPSHVLFIAAKVGNFKFVAELLGSYPDLIWERDDKNRSLFHIAVMYHQARIFHLVHKLGLYKDFILSLTDDHNNNILHLAAKSPQHELNTVSRPGSRQMQSDVLWFEEVKKVVTPFYIDMKNSEGKTPRDIFREEHGGLLQREQSWLRSTVQRIQPSRLLSFRF